MAQQDPRQQTPMPFPAMGTLTAGMDTFASRMKQLGEFNSEHLAKARELNRHWMERAAEEAKATMEMSSKFSSVHSFSDAMTLYQQWATQRLQAAGEDVNYALSAGREMMEAASRAFATTTRDATAAAERGEMALRRASGGSSSADAS